MANLSNINNILRTGSLGVGINKDPASPFEVSSATKPGIKMFNTATNGKTYQAYSDENGNYIIYDEDADDNRFVINSAGDATFAGIVTTDKIFVAKGQNLAHTTSSIKVSQENTTKSQIRFYGADTSTAGILEFVGSTSNGSAGGARLTLNADGSSTFAGTVETTTLRTDVVNNKANSANIIYRSGTSTLVGGGTTANKLYVLDSGNIGIGTTAPGSKLEVITSGANSVLELDNSDSNYTVIQYNAQGATKGFSGFNAGFMLFGGESGTTTRLQSGGSYAATILENGNFGIGTTSPSQKLHVVGDQLIFGDLLLEGSANSFRTISMNTSDGSDNQTLSLCGGATASSARGGRVEIKGNEADGSVVLVAGNVSTGDIDFYTANTQRMIINNAGNVGIGTTSPASKLVVRTSTDHNFEVEETGGELRLSALNDARSANIGLQFAASEFNFITGNVGIENTNPDAKLSVGANISSHANGISVNAGAGGGNILALGTTNHNWFPFSNGQNYYSSDQHNFRNSSHGTTFGVWNSTGLGIGTTSPTKTLQVNGSVALTTTATDGTKRFHTYPDDWHSWYYKSSVVNSQSADVMTYYQQFLIRHQDSTNVFIIRGNGNVGIANDNPASLLSVGSTSYGSTARIDCMAADSQNAEIRAFGNTQGTGVVYVGQSTAYGGGIAYNGDGSPAYGDFGTDRVTLFGRSGSTSHKVADWSYNNGDKAFNFYGPIVVSGTRGSAGQVLTSNGNAQATWETPSAGGDFKTKGVTLATVTSSGTTVATTVNASTVTNNSCGVIKFTMGHAANIIVVSFVVYETSNMWFVNRADEGENSNNDNDIIYSGVATNTLTFKAKNSSPSSGYNGVVMIECFPPSMFTL